MDAEDLFDFLPDPILLVILNKLGNLKDLGRCSLVSKRFYELAFMVDNVSVKFEGDIVADGKRKRFKNNLKRIVFESFLKTLKALNPFRNKKTTVRKGSDHTTREALKNFRQLRHLQIELPAGELVLGNDVLLKWKAEFGSTVEKCVILGAACVEKDQSDQKEQISKSRSRVIQNQMHIPQTALPYEAGDPSLHDESISLQENIYTDMEMRLSVFWTISSLVAATTRHYLFQKIISQHPSLESLTISDATCQGTLCMSKRQLQTYRETLSEGSTSLAKRHVPALKIKLWHAPYLQLSDGTSLRGATLVAMEASNQALHQDREDFITGAFEEPFDDATSILTKRRTYLLEIQSL